MQITVGLKDGHLPMIYTSQANVKRGNQPIMSFPIEVRGIPAKTKSLAISLIDYDAVPRTGFPFIHWLAANVPPMAEIPVDFSRNFEGPQGQNSWMSRFYDMNDSYFANHYAGPNPPDQAHHYTLTVYALSQDMQLENGFYYNDFRNQLVDRAIEKAGLQVLAKN
ncbi:YbhB/YbcL family Raf kinase inhibitor-like protein [Lactiplantibacillus paraplantarum]|uniref:YbhB/YbcL family Raf kinase inhibitor-like protein n=1 Tax=Lactiplantibacillus paraplantarum TaxID=60520 RepID=UPI0023AAEFC2|nr:YbhB/YbcL family Raf kinase inhibitor-like protein [Lactiplantibacillus paraplantarum]WEE37039.1 YbhB/YbcL family Raf kinase inhibitor-like protein [Lactiplantibacillus paraplantarum]